MYYDYMIQTLRIDNERNVYAVRFVEIINQVTNGLA